MPDNPKNRAVSPFSPMFAEQCIGKILLSGSKKFITPNIDFFISPAYSVPPIKTIFRVKSIRIKTSVLVPSISGSALKSLIQRMVNSGSWFVSSSLVGRINKLLENMFCHTRSLITLMGKRVSGSAPTNPSNTKSSLSSTKFFIFSKSFSNFPLGNW